MSDVQDYPSRLSDPGSRKFETFSYLPELTPEQIHGQVEYLVRKGWNPAIEHVEPSHATSNFWYMWKLPLFGETNVEIVLAEAAACRKANPAHHVRLVGYDNYTQSQGTSMVIYRGAM